MYSIFPSPGKIREKVVIASQIVYLASDPPPPDVKAASYLCLRLFSLCVAGTTFSVISLRDRGAAEPK
jgi:hypothetical protein